MTQRTSIHGLHVATPLYNFIEDQVLPAVGVKSKAFWAGFDGIVKDLAYACFGGHGADGPAFLRFQKVAHARAVFPQEVK